MTKVYSPNLFNKAIPVGDRNGNLLGTGVISQRGKNLTLSLQIKPPENLGKLLYQQPLSISMSPQPHKDDGVVVPTSLTFLDAII